MFTPVLLSKPRYFPLPSSSLCIRDNLILSQVNEIWTWNVKTYQWEFINTTYGTFSGSGIPNVPPEPREQHITAYVGGNLYILGGKSHTTGLKYDSVFGDLWRLNIEHAFPIVLSGSDENLANGILPVTLPQGQRLFLSINASASPFSNTFDENTGIGSESMCVNSIAVKVFYIMLLIEFSKIVTCS